MSKEEVRPLEVILTEVLKILDPAAVEVKAQVEGLLAGPPEKLKEGLLKILDERVTRLKEEAAVEVNEVSSSAVLEVRNMLKPEEEVITQEELGMSPALFALASFVADILTQILHDTLLPNAPKGDIFVELLPALLGVPKEGHNWNILNRRIDKVAFWQPKGKDETNLLIVLNNKGKTLSFVLPIVSTHNHLWEDSPEVINGSRGGKLMLLYPVEVTCDHEGEITNASCREGYVHKSLFHIGTDAGKKYEAFDQRMQKRFDDRETERKAGTV